MKILIVDCQEDMLTLFKQKFRKQIKSGLFDFYFAPSGEAALQHIKSRQCPSLVLILSDIGMPGMTGVELLEVLKRKYPEIKVFIITVDGSLRSHQLILNFYADFYIKKPIELDSLAAKMLQLKKILG